MPKSSDVLSQYQYDLVIGKSEAKKFLRVINEIAGDVLDEHNREPWLKERLDELYKKFCRGHRIKRGDLTES